MRATLNIPDKLIEEVQRLSGQKTKAGAIVTVMEEYVRSRKVEDLLALRGKVQIDYDWEQEEAEELKAAGLNRDSHFKTIAGLKVTPE